MVAKHRFGYHLMVAVGVDQAVVAKHQFGYHLMVAEGVDQVAVASHQFGNHLKVAEGVDQVAVADLQSVAKQGEDTEVLAKVDFQVKVADGVNFERIEEEENLVRLAKEGVEVNPVMVVKEAKEGVEENPVMVVEEAK